MEKDDEETIKEKFHTDRKDPAVWLTKQAAKMGRARRRWFVLHRQSRVLAYYSKAFIPPAQAPLKGTIPLGEVTSVDCGGRRIEIAVAKGRVPFKLQADDEKTARDWAKFIKFEAHTMGIDNPLNRAVQEACKTDDTSKEADAMYSEYQDFKHVGEDVEVAEEGGNYNTFVPNSSASGRRGSANSRPAEPSNYNDFTPNNAVSSPPPRPAQASRRRSSDSKNPVKINSKGSVRPKRPVRPQQVEGGYMDIPVGGGGAQQQQQQQQLPAAAPASATNEAENYLEIPVGGSGPSEPKPTNEAENYLEIPVGGSGPSEPKPTNEAENYLEIPVGGSGPSEKKPTNEAENYLEIPVGGSGGSSGGDAPAGSGKSEAESAPATTEDKKEEVPSDSETSSSSESDSD